MTLFDEIQKERADEAYYQSEAYQQKIISEQIKKGATYLHNEYLRMLKQLNSVFECYYADEIFESLKDNIIYTLTKNNSITIDAGDDRYIKHYKTKFDHTDSSWNEYYVDVWNQLPCSYNEQHSTLTALKVTTFNAAINFLADHMIDSNNHTLMTRDNVVKVFVKRSNRETGYDSFASISNNQIKITMHPVPYITMEYIENPEKDFARWNELTIKLNVSGLAKYLKDQGLKVVIIDTDHIEVKYPEN